MRRSLRAFSLPEKSVVSRTRTTLLTEGRLQRFLRLHHRPQGELLARRHHGQRELRSRLERTGAEKVERRRDVSGIRLDRDFIFHHFLSLRLAKQLGLALGVVEENFEVPALVVLVGPHLHAQRLDVLGVPAEDHLVADGEKEESDVGAPEQEDGPHAGSVRELRSHRHLNAARGKAQEAGAVHHLFAWSKGYRLRGRGACHTEGQGGNKAGKVRHRRRARQETIAQDSEKGWRG